MNVDYFSIGCLPAADNGHAQNSCRRRARPVSCCKMLQVLVLDDFLKCLYSFLCGSCCLLRIFILFGPTPWTFCHPNSSQNEPCGWLQNRCTICSEPCQTGFQSKTVGLQISKTLFRRHSLISWIIPWIMTIYISSDHATSKFAARDQRMPKGATRNRSLVPGTSTDMWLQTPGQVMSSASWSCMPHMPPV